MWTSIEDDFGNSKVWKNLLNFSPATPIEFQKYNSWGKPCDVIDYKYRDFFKIGNIVVFNRKDSEHIGVITQIGNDRYYYMGYSAYFGYVENDWYPIYIPDSRPATEDEITEFILKLAQDNRELCRTLIAEQKARLAEIRHHFKLDFLIIDNTKLSNEPETPDYSQRFTIEGCNELKQAFLDKVGVKIQSGITLTYEYLWSGNHNFSGAKTKSKLHFKLETQWNEAVEYAQKYYKKAETPKMKICDCDVEFDLKNKKVLIGDKPFGLEDLRAFARLCEFNRDFDTNFIVSEAYVGAELSDDKMQLEDIQKLIKILEHE